MSRHQPWQGRIALGGIWIAACAFAGLARSHDHHMDKIEEGQGVSADPIDSILWTHIFIQGLAWGILFPMGMVLGIVRSRWHVPVQVVASTLAVLGYFIGHKHKGRQFADNVHAHFAPWVMWVLMSQIVFGVYLRLHLERGFHGRIRKYAVFAHGIIGKLVPIVAWVQMLFGGITMLGFCRDDHLGQCLAHFIMGSAFIAYGILLTIVMLVGQAWLRRTGRSQEFFDSAVIAAWGCVNTFTEHRWGQAWVHNDLQHTTMGIIWWCAGLLGLWLSRNRDGQPKRNLIPAAVIFLTGWAMSAHPQTLMISAMTHTMFGYTLMAAGVSRLVEICFVLKDQPTASEDGRNPFSFQYMTPFLLCAAGFLFMGATEEQMKMLDAAHVDHVSYVLLLYSVAFLMYLFTNMLIHLYGVDRILAKADPETANGTVYANGHTSVRDVEEFELGDITSDDELDTPNDDAPLVPKEGRTH
ncbi:integral membrane protein-like protein [Trichodelitschia bisporula]|uniref:Integral membrane protein-like protein n=1 Tax=Trichodelitschia bisporula TaxID=703511 RepID=A0A6G1I8G8_9PEZI|nr:integral membrane protein-like protein [Trichodelitschia bisporula]